jgi:hypothetical protein
MGWLGIVELELRIKHKQKGVKNMGLHSYVGVEGVTVTAKTPDEIFQALDYVHTLSLEVHEAQSTELTEEIVDILSKALEQMDSLYEEHSLEFPL